MPIETEIKFRVDDLAGLSRRLEAAGFRLQTPRAFESNVLYDTPDRAMRAHRDSAHSQLCRTLHSDSQAVAGDWPR